MKLSRILVATDLWQGSEVAYAHTIELARRFDADVTLLHVSELTFYEVVTAPEATRYLEQANALIAHRINVDQGRLRAAGLRVETVERSGDPSEQIADVAEACNADLIVLGRPVGRNERHIVLGSTVKRVLHRVDRPVLIAMQKAGSDAPFSRYERILSTNDLSADSERGFAYASELASAVDAKVTLAHVLRVPRSLALLPGEPPLEVPSEATHSVHQEREDELMKLARKADATDTDLHLVVGHDVAARIAEAAVETSADLVVIPSHGHSALRRMVLGSTSERMLELVHAPVLVLPHGYLERWAHEGGLSYASDHSSSVIA